MSESRTKSTKGLTVALVVLLTVAGVMGGYILLGLNNPPQGPPVKGITGLYTVYAVVTGHRDSTFLHLNGHANINLDSANLLTSNLGQLPSGTSWLDMAKIVTITITISGPQGFTPITFNAQMQVSVGAQFGLARTVSLPSGTFTIQATSVDSDNFASQASGGLTLP